jgi:hypothetical protein
MKIGGHGAVGKGIGDAVADVEDAVVAFVGEDGAIGMGSREILLIVFPLFVIVVVEIPEIDVEEVGKSEAADQGE